MNVETITSPELAVPNGHFAHASAISVPATSQLVFISGMTARNADGGVTGIGDITWTEIEILGDEQNAPKLTLSGMAETKAKELGLTNWSVSISHSQSHSVAFVVAIG